MNRAQAAQGSSPAALTKSERPRPESELARVKDGRFSVIGANSLFQDKLPIQAEIIEAAKQGSVRYPAEQLTEGWIGGLVLEAALKGAGWPADAARIRTAMESVNVDTKGLRGGPIAWSKDNHFRSRQYYRFYRWDETKSAITQHGSVGVAGSGSLGAV